MSWYYAENNERTGPVEDTEFARLVEAGRIQPETLVWREGMPNWIAFRESGYIPPAAPGAAAAPGVEMGVCSESGKIFPRSELVEIDGKLVSAEYKNVVLQRIREGVSRSGFNEDPELIAQRIEARGWSISAGDCVSRALALVRQNFWLTVGATFLVYMVVGAAGMIPFGGLVVQGPLFGGLYFMLLRLFRGENATVGDAFSGFTRAWGQLIGASIVPTLLAVLAVVPGVVIIAVGASQSTGEGPGFATVFGAFVVLAGFIAALNLTISWVFALPLVADKQMEFWPAMKLSRRIVGMHWWQIFWVVFLTGLMIVGVMVVGVLIIVALVAWGSANQGANGLAMTLAFLTGLGLAFAFLTLLPVVFAALCSAYEQIFGAREET